MYIILNKCFIALWIPWLASIDRYLKEGATSAAQWFQRDSENISPRSPQMISQFFRNNCSHRGLPPVFSTTAFKLSNRRDTAFIPKKCPLATC